MARMNFPNTLEGRAAAMLLERKLALSDTPARALEFDDEGAAVQPLLVGLDLSVVNLYEVGRVMAAEMMIHLVEEGAIPLGVVETPAFVKISSALISCWLDGSMVGALAVDVAKAAE